MVFRCLFFFLQLPEQLRAVERFAPEAQLRGGVTNQILALVP
jgi:hypothetical protein